MSAPEKVIALLERITGTDEVRKNPDLDMFDAGILDSLGMVELMVGLSEELKLEISPAEIVREEWSTPRKIVGYVENRLPR
jgi:D-alanine--poly(phosphoribitol) ligase subunit 2